VAGARRAGYAVAICCGLATPAGAQVASAEELLRRHVELLREAGGLTIAGTAVVAATPVASFYEQRRFAPAWDDAAGRTVLLRAVGAAAFDGLRPEDFHATALADLGARVVAGGASTADRVAYDLLLTDALFTLIGQLSQGKVDPEALDAEWHLGRPIRGQDPVILAEEALREDEVAALIDRAGPHHPYYRTLKAALRHHWEIASGGGWQAVPEGPTLKPGTTDPRVVALRRRLARGGDYDGTSEVDPALFDDGLATAVRRFQTRHGLEPDGAVGKATLAALNVTVQERIAQIRVNLERARWVLPMFSGDFVLVNIAGFYVNVVRGNRLVWESRVIVGQPFHRTPVFRADMKYIVFHPTWNVTPSIARNELFPKLRKDPSYLAKANFDLVDGSGRRVDPATVDWSGRLPYRLVQRAGDDNALGEIKFMFPNRYHVYLHDTPRRDLFEKTSRTFSHGCVRVQNPFGLAEQILAAEPGWDAARIQQVRDSGRTRTVHLAQTLPVLILYWTVDPHLDGDIQFYPDVYQRDAPILAALDAPFRPARRP
jgi:murein L,D-transpeptidase YcbB/YkuD